MGEAKRRRERGEMMSESEQMARYRDSLKIRKRPAVSAEQMATAAVGALIGRALGAYR